MKKFINAIFALSLVLMPGCGWFACDCTHEEHEHHHHKPTAEAEEPSKTAALAETQVIKIKTSQEFEEKVITATKPVLVDFSAKWCGPCQAMKPIIEELAQEMGSKYIFVEVDVDAAGDIANKYNIQGIPTFTFFRDGKEVGQNSRITGAINKKDLVAALEKNLG